jgi:hypothetical protein
MATQDPQLVRVDAELTLNVTRNANGTLADGAADLVARVDGVERVDDVDVTSLTPRLNDLQVTATVTCTVACADVADRGAVEHTLADGFGVDAVEDLRIETPRRADGPLVEYG